MCWQSYQKIFFRLGKTHASALLSQGESFGTWGDGLMSFDAETWRMKVNVQLKSLYCFLCSSLSLKCWRTLSTWCKTIIFGVHAAPTFHHAGPEHTEVRKNDFQTRKVGTSKEHMNAPVSVTLLDILRRPWDDFKALCWLKKLDIFDSRQVCSKQNWTWSFSTLTSVCAKSWPDQRLKTEEREVKHCNLKMSCTLISCKSYCSPTSSVNPSKLCNNYFRSAVPRAKANGVK